MRTKENIKELLDYFQSNENEELQFDEDAIHTAYQKRNDNQSLAIKIVTVLGGLLGSLTFLGFLFLIGLANSSLSMFLGILCIAAAIWVNKKYDKILIDTVCVSTFIIGFILFGIGFEDLKLGGDFISIIFIIIALFSLGIVQNFILSFVSVLIINGSILSFIISNKSYDLLLIYVSTLALALTYIFLNEARIIKLSKHMSLLYNPLRIGLIFAFLSGLISLSEKEILSVPPFYIWMSSIILILTTINLLSKIFEILNITNTQYKTSIYIFSILLLLTTALSPAISGAILIILLCFLVNYKTGLAIGLIALISFISQYYYNLNFTLLTKSILLFSSGVLFLAIYLITAKKMESNEKI